MWRDGTLTQSMCLAGAMDIALGSGATGVFTNSSWLWNQLFEVGIIHRDLNCGDGYSSLRMIKFFNHCVRVIFML